MRPGPTRARFACQAEHPHDSDADADANTSHMQILSAVDTIDSHVETGVRYYSQDPLYVQLLPNMRGGWRRDFFNLRRLRVSLLMFQVWLWGSSSFAQRELSLVTNLSLHREGAQRSYEAMFLGRRGNLLCAFQVLGLPSQRGTLQRLSETNLPSNLDNSRVFSLLEKDAPGCPAHCLDYWPETTKG